MIKGGQWRTTGWLGMPFLVSIALISPVMSGEVPSSSQGDWLTSLPSLYSGMDGSKIQSVDLRGIVHWQSAHVDARQGKADESEFRRFRFGFDARFLKHFSFRGTANFDPEGDQFYRNLSRVFVSYSPYGNEKGDFERFRVSLGKLRPRFSSEYSTSAKRLKTFERSLLANQLAPSRTTGLLFGGQENRWDYTFAVFAGENSPEFSWFDEGGVFLAKMGYSPEPDLRIGLDYLGVFGEQDITSEISHALSLSVSHNPRYASGDFSFLAEGLLGAGDRDQSDVFGIVLLASYQFDERWEFVGRYQFARASDERGLRLQRRYERAVVNDPDAKWGERYHAAYLGLNYRLHDERLKLMAGVEYSRMEGESEFEGWTWFAGLRSWF